MWEWRREHDQVVGSLSAKAIVIFEEQLTCIVEWEALNKAITPAYLKRFSSV